MSLCLSVTIDMDTNGYFYLLQLTRFLIHGAYFNAAQLEPFLMERIMQICVWVTLPIGSWGLGILLERMVEQLVEQNLIRPCDSPLLDTTVTAAAPDVTWNDFFQITRLSYPPSAESLLPQNNKDI